MPIGPNLESPFAIEEGFAGGRQGSLLGSHTHKVFQGNVKFAVKAADHLKR